MRLLSAALLGLAVLVCGQSQTGNRPATFVSVRKPNYVALDRQGNVYFTDGNQEVLRLDAASGVLRRVAGAGTAGYDGDGGPAETAQLNYPHGLAFDSAGALYIADTLNRCVRKVANGVITTVAGSAKPGPPGDNGPAVDAWLNTPVAVAVDSAGDLYIADPGAGRVRKVSQGVITTVAGIDRSGYSGDNGPATAAALNQPNGVAVDEAGNLYIADSFQRIRKVSHGVITSVRGGTELGDDGTGPWRDCSFRTWTA